jgi:MFS family permease
VILDPRERIATEPMHYRQVLAVALVIACIAIDGFDVFSIAFAAPLIADAWNVSPAGLGVVLSMELFGMGVGSYFVGALADRAGRRRTIIGSLVITASGMWLASLSTDVTELATTRVLTGLGIGGILVAGSTLISETANDRHRDTAVALMVAGYPLGVALGGVISADLLERTTRWQPIFEIGAVATALILIPVCLFLTESVSFLSANTSAQSQQRMNHVLGLYGKSHVSGEPVSKPSRPDAKLSKLRPIGISKLSITLTVAFFLHMMVFYFLMKWIPKLVVDLGHTPSTASMVVVWANIAGATGALLMSVLTLRYALRVLVVGGMACGGAAVILFGQQHDSLYALSAAAGVAGFFTTGATAGFYALLTRSFSSRVRAGNTGFVIGLGRAGAAAGPITAGLLFGAGWPLSLVAATLGCIGLLASAVVHRTASIAEPARRLD